MQHARAVRQFGPRPARKNHPPVVMFLQPGAHIGRCVGMGFDQAHPQAQARQQQPQALPDNAGTTDTNIECGFHGA